MTPGGVQRNREAAQEWIGSDSALAHRMMVRARTEHRGEQHSNHCWDRLAWGDGECECKGNTEANDTMSMAFKRER